MQVQRLLPDLAGNHFCVSAKRFEVFVHIVDEQRSGAQNEANGGDENVTQRQPLTNLVHKQKQGGDRETREHPGEERLIPQAESETQEASAQHEPRTRL